MQLLPEHRPVPIAFLLLLGIVLWGGEYVRRDLWEPDEARYAYVAGEMRQSGNWSVPSRHGESYAHKPPLMFWLINLSASVSGGRIDGLSVRLPSLLGSLMSLWAAARLIALWRDPRAAWRTVLILVTTYLFWFQGGMGQIDALLCGLQMMALYFFFADDRSPTVWRPFLAYTCMGLAILAKGPVGFLVPAGVYIAATWAAGERKALARSHWIWGPLVTLLFPALWLGWAWLGDHAPAAYFADVLWKQNVGRSAGEYGHRRPLYYFLQTFPTDFLPWTLFLPAAWVALRRQPGLTGLRRRLTAWVVFVLVFFTLPSSKRNLYVLLAFPAAAMFIAVAWERLDGPWGRVTARIAMGLLALLGCGAMGVALFYRALPISGWTLLPSALAMLAGAVLTWRIFRKDGLSAGWFYAFAGAMLVAQLSVGSVVYPAMNPLKTPVELAAAARARLPAGQRLLLYRMDGEILALYGRAQGRRIDNEEELRAAMDRQRRGIVALGAREWKDLQPRLRNVLVPHPFKMGGKNLVWCEFDVTRPAAGT